MVQTSALSLAALSVISLAAVGGGVSYASKDAQPGDFLYPVHVTVYGDISADAEAELNAAEELYKKASDIRARGELSTQVQAEFNSRYSTHIDEVKSIIVELENDGRTDDAEDVRARLRSKVRVFSDIFRTESDSNTSSSMSSSSTTSSSASSDDDDENDVDVNSSLHMESETEASVDSNADANADVDVNAEATSTVNINQD